MGFFPVAMAGLSLAKGVMGAVGASQTASANAANYNVQGQIALNNAAIARQQEVFDTGAGEFKTTQTGLIGAAKVAAATGAMAKGGVDINTGSNLNIRDAATRAASVDSAVSQSDMARKAWGYQVAASNFGNQASADVAGANNARRAGRTAAIGSLLDGVIGAAGSMAGGGMGSFGKFSFGGGGGGGNGVGNDPAQFGIY